MATNVRELLKSEMHFVGSERAFLNIDREELFSAIQRHVIPMGKPKFSEVLSKPIDLVWPHGYELTPTNFKVAYERYLLYRTKWLKRYEFCKEDNTSSIPECKDSLDGLIGIFLKGISNFSYPRTLFSRIPSVEKKNFRDEDGFEKFLKTFYDMMREDYEKAKYASQLLDNIKDRKDSKSPATEKRQSDKWSGNNNNQNRTNRFQKKSFDKSKRMMSALNVEGFPIEDEHYDESNAINFDEETSSNYDQREDNESFEAQEKGLDNVKIPQEEEKECIKEELNVISPAYSDAPPCCFQKLFFNECQRAKCTYSHKPEDLSKGFYFYVEKLRKCLAKPAGVSLTITKDSDKALTPYVARNDQSPRILRRMTPKIHEGGEY
jgi:hypothetical protein